MPRCREWPVAPRKPAPRQPGPARAQAGQVATEVVCCQGDASPLPHQSPQTHSDVPFAWPSLTSTQRGHCGQGAEGLALSLPRPCGWEWGRLDFQMTIDSCSWKKGCGGISSESVHSIPEKGGSPLDTPPHMAPWSGLGPARVPSSPQPSRRPGRLCQWPGAFGPAEGPAEPPPL